MSILPPEVSGCVYRGATARWQARKVLADNPYPPGTLKHRAWEFGYLNAAEVLARHDANGDPNYEAPPIDLPPVR